jgi:Flp pilus assembly protein TadD
MAERAVRLNDNDEYSHWILGLLQMAVAEFDKAIAELKRAIEINPNCSLAYGSLGTVLNHAGHPEEAIENNEIAIRSNPRDPSIFYRYNGLALSYYLLKQFETALEWASPDFSQGSLRRRIGGGPWMRVVVLRIRPAGSAGSGGFWTRWSSRYGRDPVCESAQKAARWR